jgi:hypothetical protein
MSKETEAAVARQEAQRMERRSAPRLDKIFPVFLEGDRGSGLGVARNISEGGIFIETRDPYPLASQVRVTFPSDGGEMSAIAEVRYVCHLMGKPEKPGSPERSIAVRGMGLRFLYFEASADSRAVIH